MARARTTGRLRMTPLLWLWALASVARESPSPAVGFEVGSVNRLSRRRWKPHRRGGRDQTRMPAAGPDGGDGDPDEYDFEAFEGGLRARAREEERRLLTVRARAGPPADEGGLSENQMSLVSLFASLALIVGIASASQSGMAAFSARAPDEFESPAVTKEVEAYRTSRRSSADGPGATRVDLNALLKD